VLNKQIKA